MKDHLKQFGSGLKHVDVASNDQGRSKGYAIAEYDSVEEATAVIEAANDTELNGRTIFVREDKEAGKDRETNEGSSIVRPNKRQNNNGNRIFVGNLSWETQWQELKDFCRRAGTVTFADVATDNEGKAKGFGFVEFETDDEASNAINILNGAFLRGRNVLVREDRKK